MLRASHAHQMFALAVALLAAGAAGIPSASADMPHFAAGQVLRAGGAELVVTGYSVPSLADWNNDGLPDLVVGEGGGGWPGMVRVYLNVGTPTSPAFDEPLWAALASGADLVVPSAGCLGAFPRVTDWDADGRKDLLVGRADGRVELFRNVGPDAAPLFQPAGFVQVGPTGAKTDIDVGSRATPALVDWNRDGRDDLLVGAYDGRFRLFLDGAQAGEPQFAAEIVLADALAGADLRDPSGRTSPDLADLDGDGRRDLLAGNTDGRLLLYLNIGTDEAPAFSSQEATALLADGEAIDLPGSARCRPSLVDWRGDGRLDVLAGASDGRVRLYEQVPEPTAALLLAGAALMGLPRRRR